MQAYFTLPARGASSSGNDTKHKQDSGKCCSLFSSLPHSAAHKPLSESVMGCEGWGVTVMRCEGWGVTVMGVRGGVGHG